jgi:D-3-phosphoglycerate dehydrogenase / 2-oxoglutarate reductase
MPTTRKKVVRFDALDSGHLSGAGPDVWEREPPPLDHPLLRRENVIVTYHTAGVTHEARRNMAVFAAEQIVGLLKGGRPPRLVNPEGGCSMHAVSKRSSARRFK